MASDIEHLFMCLFAIIFIILFSKRTFAHFLVGLFVLLLLTFESSVCILIGMSPWSDMWSADSFSWTVVCLFILLPGFVTEQKFSI